jgi:ACT domain-containing protein
MIMLVDLSETTEGISELAKECAELGKAIGMTIYIQHEDIFNAMHTI